MGSKTTHCVPSSIDSSTKMNSRRTLTYFHWASADMVRAPHTRMPRPVGTEVADDVDAPRVEDVVLPLGDQELQRLPVAGQVAGHDAADLLVGRRLVHAALDVGAGVDAGHVARPAAPARVSLVRGSSTRSQG